MYKESGAEADRIDIEELFEETLRKCYAEDYKKNKGKHFSSPEELREFFVGILHLNKLSSEQ